MIATSEIVRTLRRRHLANQSQCYDIVHLADNEWDDGTTMETVADEWFRQHPECQFVMIREHAGWCLGFRRDGSIWSTANDMAVLRKPNPKPTSGPRLICRRQTGDVHNLNG